MTKRQQMLFATYLCCCCGCALEAKKRPPRPEEAAGGAGARDGDDGALGELGGIYTSMERNVVPPLQLMLNVIAILGKPAGGDRAC